MSGFRQINAHEWEWDKGRTIYSVRLFPAQGTLVWANRVETSEGPQFGAGKRQTVAQFNEYGPPDGIDVPEALVTILCEALTATQTPSQRRGFLARLFGR